MSERKFDQWLGIKTVGIRELKQSEHNRYEATPYKALDQLFKSYTFHHTDRVVDFGCGRGRTMFYIHHHFHIPVTGIEAHDKTFEEALNNKYSYRQRAKHIPAPISFEYGLAEHYHIDEKDNTFYFFNPFSLSIFKKVVDNILQSFATERRRIEIIFYYPLPPFEKFLQTETPFKLLNKINVPGVHGKYGKFLIYRLE
ncbi:MAG TPA: class I SAM-dependent methyltransferase [Bacillota bacterium]